MDNYGKVSVVIPVHNAEKFITPAVESIKNQTYTDFEILLVDDGSTDESGSIIDALAAEDERIRVFHIDACCAADARNHGTMASTGRFLSFLDADDLWSPEKLEHELG